MMYIWAWQAAAFEPAFVAPVTVAADPTGAGSWGPVIPWTPHIPVTAATLPDGRELAYGQAPDPEGGIVSFASVSFE